MALYGQVAAGELELGTVWKSSRTHFRIFKLFSGSFQDCSPGFEAPSTTGNFPPRRIDEKPLFTDRQLGASGTVGAAMRQQNAVLNGAYVFTVTGTAGSPVWAPFTGPVATMGIYVFDGAGNLQGPIATVATANPPINVTPPNVITGTYTVNPNCTGNLTLNFSPAPNAHYNLVASPDGRQITMIATDKGDVLLSTATRLEFRGN